MMDAEPMTMPSMVSRKRTLEARKLSMASRVISLKTMVVRALASVASKVPGLGRLVVAMTVAIGRHSVSQRCGDFLLTFSGCLVRDTAWPRRDV